MEKKTTNQEQLFKEKLHDYKEEPLTSSWENISKKLDIIETPIKPTRPLYEQAWVYAVAASVSVLVIAGWFYLSTPERKPIANNTPIESTVNKVVHDTIIEPQVTHAPIAVVETPVVKHMISEKTVAGKKTLVLPDGSTVTLNHDSELRYDKSTFKTDRVVYLKGQAFFDVSHDPQHAFIVFGHLSKTEVLGTTFTLRSYKSEHFDELNVSRGKVSFEKLLNNPEKTIILAGYKAIISEQSLNKELISDVNYDAWQTEKIVFNKTPLKEVFSTLEDYYQIPISTATPEILNCRFTGVFEKSNINEVLQVLSVSFNLSFNEGSKNYTISGKGCQ